LKRFHIPHLIGFKCIAHKASLGIKDLAKKFDIVDELNISVYKICSIFHTKKSLDLLNLNIHKILHVGEDESVL